MARDLDLTETSVRGGAKALGERVRRARFEEVTTLEEFDFSFNTKVPAAVIRDLAALRFVEASESIILYGPVGVGKTHVAQSLGHAALPSGLPGDLRQVRPGGSQSWQVAGPTGPGTRGSADWPDPTSSSPKPASGSEEGRC